MQNAIKSAMIGARVYPTEAAALRALARREGRAQSDVLRELVRQAARQAGVWPAPASKSKESNDATT